METRTSLAAACRERGEDRALLQISRGDVLPAQPAPVTSVRVPDCSSRVKSPPGRDTGRAKRARGRKGVPVSRAPQLGLSALVSRL